MFNLRDTGSSVSGAATGRLTAHFTESLHVSNICRMKKQQFGAIDERWPPQIIDCIEMTILYAHASLINGTPEHVLSTLRVDYNRATWQSLRVSPQIAWLTFVQTSNTYLVWTSRIENAKDYFQCWRISQQLSVVQESPVAMFPPHDW